MSRTDVETAPAAAAGSAPTKEDSAANRRMFTRVKLPVDILIDGKNYTMLDASLGGFRIAGFAAEMGQVEDVVYRLNAPSLLMEFKVSARAVFIDRNKLEAGFEFVNLDPQQAFILDALCTAARQSSEGKAELGDEFLNYASKRADRAVKARCMAAPLAI